MEFERIVDKVSLPFAHVRKKYEAVYVIVSPPRCSSTAFARVFWEHPTVHHYSHEPFEVTYYRGEKLHRVVEKLKQPLDLRLINNLPADEPAQALVIKEMPYQMGRHFPILTMLATGPLVFIIRDPRLNIASRMEKKVEGGASPFYPQIESGWDLIAGQMRWCRERGVPYMIVDATDFRNAPERVFPQIFERLGLSFVPEMLTWKPYADVDLDNLEGAHRHLYQRVLESRGLEPANEPVPSADSFPTENGFREHVAHCLEIYAALRDDEARIRP